MSKVHRDIAVILLALCLSFGGLSFGCQSSSEVSTWESLADGFEVRSFKVSAGDSPRKAKITVLRIDPSRWSLELRSRSEIGGPNDKNIMQWCNSESEVGELVAGINAGLYNKDFSSHIGYMKSGELLNNPKILRNQYFSAALFGAETDDVPDFQMIDLDVTKLDSLIDKYRYVIQNLRLIKFPSENRWEEKTRKWSEAALAEDSSGNALFIFAREPFNMVEFSQTILSLPLGIIRAQHLEGGPEAQMYYKVGDLQAEFVGSYESGSGDNSGSSAWPIPNAIVVKTK